MISAKVIWGYICVCLLLAVFDITLKIKVFIFKILFNSPLYIRQVELQNGHTSIHFS